MRQNRQLAFFSFFSLSLGALAGAGCGDDSLEPGTLEVAVYGEAFVEEGIPADEMIDGWTVEFDTFEVELGDVTAAEGGQTPALEAASYQVFDLAVGTDGRGQLVAESEVPGGSYDAISYRIANIAVSGRATRGEVTKTFSWTLATPTRYAGCAGTAVVDGTTARTQLTIHADHLFYDDLVSEEPNVAFDLIASADDAGDADGVISQDELAAVDIATLERYQVGNRTEVTDLWAFIDAQASTVGHIDGEGHCDTAQRD